MRPSPWPVPASASCTVSQPDNDLAVSASVRAGTSAVVSMPLDWGTQLKVRTARR